MARRTKNPLAIESPQTRAARQRAIDLAIRRGALSGVVGSMVRRDILAERAVRGYQQEAAAEWARSVDVAVLAAVSRMLATRPEVAAAIPAIKGEPSTLPRPDRLPVGFATQLGQTIREQSAPVWRSIDANLVQFTEQEVAFTAKNLVR